MANVTVSNEKIVRLHSGAQGFRTAFYVIYNSAMSKEGCESWAQEGDFMSVLGTNGCFAIELYLKFIMVIDSFNTSTGSGDHLRRHSLDILYDYLKNQNSSIISDLESLYSSTTHKHSFNTLRDFLASIRDYFIDWRYSYDSGALNVNLNTLSDVLNIFEDYSLKKFKSISGLITISSASDGQSMSIDDFDDIKKD